MKFFISPWILLCVHVLPLFGFHEAEFDMQVGVDYRVDSLRWSASRLPVVNVLRQEKWKGIESVGITALTEACFCNGVLLQVEGDYGWMGSGKKEFDEFDLDNRGESLGEGWLKAHSRGCVYDISGGIGYASSFLSPLLQATPMVGFEYSVQSFKDHRYEDSLYLINFFGDIKSSYRYRWMGPWIGTQYAFQYKNYFLSAFEYRFHWIWYRGIVNDNFFTHSQEIQKNSHVIGNEFTLRLVSACWENWGIGILGNYLFTSGKNGHSIINGQTFSLEKLRWNSGKVSFYYTMLF